MTKAVLLSLGFIFLLATAVPPAASAQGSAAADAVNRAVLDQAYTLSLRQKLYDAKGAVARGDLTLAAKDYEDAYALVQQIGPSSNIAAETAQTISGLAATRMQLARQDQGNQDLIGAQTEVNRVLKVDPQNQQALAFKKQNDQMIADSKGKMPDKATLEQVPVVQNEITEANTHVQNGKLLYEMGKTEEAEVEFNAALKLDPSNQAAIYYLRLTKQSTYGIEEQRHTIDTDDRMLTVEKGWKQPVNRSLTRSTLRLPDDNPYATTNLIYTGGGRQLIQSKLDRIHVDVEYPGLPLSEVISRLSILVKQRDPDKKGINFLVNNYNGAAAAGAAPTPLGGPGGAVDPATGLPVAQPAAAGGGEAFDIRQAVINLSPELTDVRLADVLDAIVQVSDHPIKYTVEDAYIVFSPKGPEMPQFYTRTFKVDPNTFYSGLQGVSSQSPGGGGNNNTGGGNNTGGNNGGGNTSGGNNNGGGNNGGGNNNNGGGNNGGGNSSSGSIGGGTIAVVTIPVGGGGGGNNTGGNNPGGGRGGGPGGAAGGAAGGNAGNGGLRFLATGSLASESDISLAARTFFTTLGVNLDTPPGKTVFFNDRLGYLFVKATDEDLDTIERAMQVLNQVAPQVHIKSRFIEVRQDDNKALGFDWYLGQFGNTVVGSGGTAPSLNVPVSAANPLGTFPGSTAASQVAGAATDQLLTSGLRNSGPALASFTGILTDPNFRVVIHALEQRSGFETLGEPEVTTTSGRQTEMKATTIQTVITSINFNNGAGNATSTAAPVGGNTTVNPGAAAATPVQTTVELGPILDVVPYVLSDGYTINLALIPSDTEFDGYDTPPTIPGVTVTGGGSQAIVTVPPVLPIFTVRQVITTVNVWDNQTVVLGGLITSKVVTTKDTVPFLGNLPVVGSLFQSQSKTQTKDNLMIFVTATIVDPAGNRVHSDDELPFAQTVVPTQPTGAGDMRENVKTIPPPVVN